MKFSIIILLNIPSTDIAGSHTTVIVYSKAVANSNFVVILWCVSIFPYLMHCA
jgi:hypothetical protein